MLLSTRESPSALCIRMLRDSLSLTITVLHLHLTPMSHSDTAVPLCWVVSNVQGLACWLSKGGESSDAKFGYILSVTYFIHICTSGRKQWWLNSMQGKPFFQESQPHVNAHFTESNSASRIYFNKTTNSPAAHTVSSPRTTASTRRLLMKMLSSIVPTEPH